MSKKFKRYAEVLGPKLPAIKKQFVVFGGARGHCSVWRHTYEGVDFIILISGLDFPTLW